MKLCVFVGMNLGGYVGWSLGANNGIWVAFFAGSLGSILGVYLGWRFARHYLA